jgi:hypothetical protein
MVLAISFWQPIASMVTIDPFSVSTFNSSGMAVISLDFSATLTWPSTRRCRLDHAEIMWIGAFPPPS